MTSLQMFGVALAFAVFSSGTIGCAAGETEEEGAGEDTSEEVDQIEEGLNRATGKVRVRAAIDRGNALGLVCHMDTPDGNDIYAARCYHGRRTPDAAARRFVSYGRRLDLKCGVLDRGGENGTRKEAYCLWDKWL